MAEEGTATIDEARQRAQAPWAAGDWDAFSRLIAPVGALVVERIGLEPGMALLDVGTGSGGNLAIPAAERGATVTGLDLTPSLLVHAERRAAEAGVEVDWVEGDAQELPFPDGSFDRVTSTFGAMFAPDHRRTAGELVRVCRPGGRIAMTTWVTDGMAGELFRLAGRFLPPPPGAGVPARWGDESHIHDMFAAAGATIAVTRKTVEFSYPSVQALVDSYSTEFGVFVVARQILEPQGRWEDFIGAFTELVERFNLADDGSARIASDFLLILAAG